MKRLVLVLVSMFVASACDGRDSALVNASDALPQGQGTSRPPPAASPAPAAKPVPVTGPSMSPQPVSAARPAPSGTAGGGVETHDDPKISRSPGEPGGVLVLWPRVIPADITDLNRKLVQDVQTHLRVLVQRALPGRPIDVRPEPERVCRRSGCEATSVSVLFTRKGEGCAVVAVITPPGPVETTLVPWAAGVQLSRTQIPFREAPESVVKVKDLARCSELLELMRQNDAAIESAVRAATPGAG